MKENSLAFSIYVISVKSKCIPMMINLHNYS